MASKITRLDVVSSSLSYGGKAAPGSLTSQAVWRIREITVVGNETIVKTVSTGDNYDQIWNNRASLTYI